MNPTSTRTFVWASVISALLGMVVMSHAGSFSLYALAAVAALIPTIFGGRNMRIAGIVILAVSISLLAVTYPKYKAEMTRYEQNAVK